MYFIIPRILQQKRQQQLPQEEDEQQNAALPLAALSVIKEEATGRAPRAGPAHALDATSSSSSPYAGKDWASPSQSLSAPSPAVCAAMEDCLYQAQQSLSAPSPAVCAAMGDSLHKAQQAALVQELIVSPIAPAALTACSASPELLSEAAAGGRASTRPEDGVGARRLRSSPAPATAAAADGVDSGARLWRGGGRKPWVEAWRRFSSGSSSCNNDDSSDSDHYCPPLPAFSTRSRPGSLRAAAAVMAGARDVRPVLSGYRNEPAAPLGFTTKAASAASSLDKSGADTPAAADATLLEGYRLLHAPSDVAARLQAVLEGSEPVLDLSSTNLGTP